jgi:hypothetical protein
MSFHEASNILGYAEPFSSNNQPKIPDNKVSASIGKRVKYVKEIKLSMPAGFVTATDKPWGYLLLSCPGPVIGHVLYRYRTTIATGLLHWEKVSDSPSEIMDFRYNDDVRQFIDTKKQYDAYRMVSSGFRLTDTGNDNSTYGFWEAISVPTPSTSEVEFLVNDWLFAAAGEYNTLLYHNRFLDSVLTNKWTDYESYNVGSIKALDSHEFINPHLEHERHFKKIHTRKLDPLAVDEDSTVIPVANGTDPNRWLYKFTGRSEDLLMFEQIIDSGFKTWCVRFEKPDENARILLEVVMNIELTTRPESSYHQFASSSKFTDKFNDNKSKIKTGHTVPIKTKEKAKTLDDILSKNKQGGVRRTDVSRVTRGQSKRGKTEPTHSGFGGFVSDIKGEVAADIGSAYHGVVDNVVDPVLAAVTSNIGTVASNMLLGLL